MSMLSAQIDELRKWADQLSERENEFGVVVRALVAALRDAADTIWQLRDDLQRANAENAKLEASNELIGEDHAALCEQNAKLRELVRDLWHLLYDWLFKAHEVPYDELKAVSDRMRELGVEVD